MDGVILKGKAYSNTGGITQTGTATAPYKSYKNWKKKQIIST